MIHTGAMFMFVTVFTVINLNIISTSYIDNRKFPNDPYPGPLGFQALTYSETIGIVSTVMFLLNNWLADGLLVKSVPASAAQVSDVTGAVLLALSLLYYISYEPLGYRLPILNISRQFWFVPGFPSGFWLISLIQRPVSRSSTIRQQNQLVLSGVPPPSTLASHIRSPFRSTCASLS